MTKSTALILILPETEPGQIEQILLGSTALEEIHQRLALVFQAFQGACLTRLKELHGHHNVARHSASCGVAWEALIKKQFGFSDDKARRLMQVWEGMRPLVDKLPPADRQRFLDFLRRPQLHLTPAEVAVLQKITHKITDSKTQREFLLERGFIKLSPEDVTKQLSSPGRPAGSTNAAQPDELYIQDELFGRFGNVSDIVKAWHKERKLGKGKVPAWQIMTVAQKEEAAHWLDTTIADLSDMRKQVKEALGQK